MPDRPPFVANSFYTAAPGQLARSVDTWLHPPLIDADHAAPEPVHPLMVLLPHAGHMYCGRIIGATLARVRLPRRLIVLCPSHTGEGAALAVWPDGCWHTPLGPVPVDAPLAASLMAHGGGFCADITAHRREHAIEVLLPFVQRHSPEASVVPVVVSTAPDALQQAGHALALTVQQAAAEGQPVAVIVSSDMHHFSDDAENRRRDRLALEPLLRLDPVGLYNTVVGGRISMCGVQPATLALFAALELGAERAELVAYTTSAEASGDSSRVVGYAGLWVA